MNKEARIQALIHLGQLMGNPDERMQAHFHRTHFNNNWFTIENQTSSSKAIAREFLAEDKLRAFTASYDIKDEAQKNKVGLIPAANIPLVGFHDMMCIFLSGNVSVIKVSERDRFMLPFLAKLLTEFNPEAESYFEFPQNLPLKSLDAVIATGSDNSSRYFEYYFSKVPNIIRKNRTSIAVLQGDESKEEIIALGQDIFQYFGLGCRNVSKIYAPENYDFNAFMEILHEPFKNTVSHPKYKNNFDYQFSLYILNKFKHYSNGALLAREAEELVSPISTIHFECYNNLENLSQNLQAQSHKIQCISTKSKIPNLDTVPLGKAQSPSITDYADGVDTMEFLINN